MSMLSPAAIYQRQQKNPDFDLDNSHHLIRATLEYLTRSLGALSHEAERGSEHFQTHTARVLMSVYVLQSSLDFERGRDVSTNLFQLYEYTRQQALKLMRGDETARIDQAYNSMREISDAWKQIS
jgi:flagellar protein FliS